MLSTKVATVLAIALSAGFPLEALASTIFDISVTSNGVEPGFDIASVTAYAGETINFVLDKEATVIRSTFNAPCTPYSSPREAELDLPFESRGDRFQQVHISDAYDGSPLWFASTKDCRQGVVFAINPSESENWEAFRARAIQLDTSAITETPTHKPPLLQRDAPLQAMPSPQARAYEARHGNVPVKRDDESSQTAGIPTSDPQTTPIPTRAIAGLPVPSNRTPPPPTNLPPITLPPTNLPPIYQTAPQQLPVEQPTMEQPPADQLPTEQTPAHPLPTDQMSTSQNPAPQIPTGHLPTGPLPAPQLPTSVSPTSGSPTNQPPVYQAAAPSSTNSATIIHSPPDVGEQILDGSTPGTPDPTKGSENTDLSTDGRGEGVDHVGQDTVAGMTTAPATMGLTSHPGIPSKGRPTTTRTIAMLPGTTIVEVRYEPPEQSNTLDETGSATSFSKPFVAHAFIFAVVSICL